MGYFFSFAPFGFYGGLPNVRVIFQSATTPNPGFGYNLSLLNLIKMIKFYISGNSEPVSSLWLPIVIAIVMVLCLGADSKWKMYFGLTMAIVWIPEFSYTYVLLFFIIPVLSFLCDEDHNLDWVYSILFSFLLIPTTWGGRIEKLNTLPFTWAYMTWPYVIIYLSIIIFVICLFADIFIRSFSKFLLKE